MSNNAIEYRSNRTGGFIVQTLQCNNNAGCNFYCQHTISCVETNIYCNSSVGCNIVCSAGNSCDDMRIIADQSRMSSATTSIVIVCLDKESCARLHVNVTGISRAEIHCLGPSSCIDAMVNFNEISSKNNTNTSIYCYTENACTNMNIHADGAYTKLLMYQYSSNVNLYNNVGYLSDLQTVSCGLDGRYIKYDLNGTKSIQNLINNEYSSSTWPCQAVTVICGRDKNVINGSCSMEYTVHEDNVINNDRFFGAECVYIELTDITSLTCNGECLSSPTTSPTATPTGNPSYSPSFSPTLSPTNIPTMSPTDAPIFSPTVSPTKSPTLPPTNAPTTSPTLSPTQSPTRYPTPNGIILDRKIDIIYFFRNLTNQNYQFILNYSEKIEELIEQNYFDSNQLPSYSLFTVQINKLNQMDINKDKLTVQLVQNEKILYAKSVVKFQHEYTNVIVRKSQSLNWQIAVTNTFRVYFNNSVLHFGVANGSNLHTVFINESIDNNFNVIFWIITGILLSCIMIPICISRCTRMYKMGLCLPVDSTNWFSLILLGLSTYDVATNVNFAIDIFNDNTSSEITVCGIIILLFVIFKLILNLYYTINIDKLISYNISAKHWFKKYKNTFILFVIFSGGNCYPILSVVSSNLFGIKFTNSGISSLELKTLYIENNKILLNALLIECIPQLIAQFIYIFSIKYITPNFLSAFVSTLIFFLFYTIYYFINCSKNKRTQKMNIFYYIEVKLKEEISIMTSIKPKERKHINNRKGLKSALKNEFINLHQQMVQNHIKNNFEIGNVTIRRKGFIIRFIHRLSQNDLLSVNPNELESELKTYCFNLFNSNKEEIIEIIFNHYYDLDSNKFEIKYHKEYPFEKSMNINVMNGKHIGTKSNSFDNEEGEIDDIDNDDNDEDGDGNFEQRHLNEHRLQFKRAVTIIKQENKTKHNDYNHLMFVLQANNISYTVIDDVLNYATKAGILEKKALSDIDNSDDSDQCHLTTNINKYNDNGYNVIRNKGVIEMQKMNR